MTQHMQFVTSLQRDTDTQFYYTLVAE